MTSSGMPGKHQSALEPVDEKVDHVRGPVSSPLILEYGDYECPYSRRACREIERVETELAGRVRFAFRHFPLTQIHPHALAAAAAAEAAARQGRFWDMHELLFPAKEPSTNKICSNTPPTLDWTPRCSTTTGPVLWCWAASAGTSTAAWRRAKCWAPRTLFVNGAAHRGGCDAATLLKALAP